MIGPVGTIGIVGAGAVGQAVAATLVTAGFSRNLLIASRSIEQAASLAADADDLRTVLGSPTRSAPISPAGLHPCDAVVVAVRADFTNRDATDTRMGGILANTTPVFEVAAALRGFEGVVLVVTNPVDLMTRLFAQVSGCGQVYGIGSNLDTARYRQIVAANARVPVSAVDGHVIGEHGDAAVICASATTVNGRPYQPHSSHGIRQALRQRPSHIAAGTGRVRAGPAGAVLSALVKTLGLADGPENLSVPRTDGGHGTPLRFTAGHPKVAMPSMTAEESAQLAAADTKLRAAYQHITQHLEHT